jgi:DNA invertase Pin-like site-specific DNA recombinase
LRHPSANRLTLHILAAVAEHEREMISQRTAAGLAAAKARGVKLGNRKIAEDNLAAAQARDAELEPILRKTAGLPARAAAREIERQGHGYVSYKLVQRARSRLGIAK